MLVYYKDGTFEEYGVEINETCLQPIKKNSNIIHGSLILHQLYFYMWYLDLKTIIDLFVKMF